jgi:hypothetical protein
MVFVRNKKPGFLFVLRGNKVQLPLVPHEYFLFFHNNSPVIFLEKPVNKANSKSPVFARKIGKIRYWE